MWASLAGLLRARQDAQLLEELQRSSPESLLQEQSSTSWQHLQIKALKVQVRQLRYSFATEVQREAAQTCQPGGVSVVRIKPRIQGTCLPAGSPLPEREQLCSTEQHEK